jgi:hypothetical protein
MVEGGGLTLLFNSYEFFLINNLWEFEIAINNHRLEILERNQKAYAKSKKGYCKSKEDRQNRREEHINRQ